MAIGAAIKVSGGSSSVAGYPAINANFDEIGEAVLDVNTGISSGSTITAMIIGFAVADIQHICMLSNVNMTLRTNFVDQTAGGDTFELVAGRPLIWNAGDGYFPCPFTENVVALFAFGQSAGQLRCRFLV
ncbi:hypothetical protein [Paludisphaera borealis]|uniref:Uncharacterized protein n=1 Tax=Paludisphaera borealis TaxID=1387353 RepID=A0A1U7CXA9_9BACT|nr:hypothetical protein [Paludisphaera borealis]APW63536.1 hypothetical protein BSF38_05108 [Paludisphaera borealis]